MNQVERGCDSSTPGAPSELDRFAFLLGQWRCEARIRLADGNWRTLQGTWCGRLILDGHAIADEYRMTGESGQLAVLGLNIRAYNATTLTWQMKWLDALTGTWVDLGPQELGGVSLDGRSISYVLREPVAAHAYTRAVYSTVSEDHFTWRGDKSDDGVTWTEFMVVEAHRVRD